MKIKITEIDFTEQILNRQMAKLAQNEADEKAGYPPKCNPGYEATKDGKKCVKVTKTLHKSGIPKKSY